MALIASALVAAPSAHAQISPEVQRGLTWLQTQVQVDGSLTGETASIATGLQARSEALITLKLLNAAPVAIASLQTALGSDSETSTEYLARRAWALGFSGIDQLALIDQLQQRQNIGASNGGYGGDIGYTSHALDTAFVLLAQKAATAPDTAAVANALVYLNTAKAGDGSFSIDQQPSVYVTIKSLLAAAAWSNQTSTGAITAPAQQWLLAQRNASLHFGNSFENALALWAFTGQTSQATILQPLVDALKADQLADGSWNDDPYLTALALRALFLVTQTPPAPTTGAINGMVVDGSNSTALGNVTVQIITNTPDSTTSSASGSFGFAGVAPGTLTLRFSKLGYASKDLNVTLAAGQSLNVGTIAMVPATLTASLSGVVRNQGGTALPNATVSVGTASATTDASGAYLITGLSPGSATITAAAVNYQQLSASISFEAGTNYTFSPRLTANGSTPPSTTSLNGVVIDAGTKLPLVGATVQMGATSQTTGAGGAFAFNAIVPGAFVLKVAANGFQTAAATGVTVAGINNIGSIGLVRLPASSTLSGTVTDAITQLPIGGASVSVQGQGVPVTTTAAGKYSIAGLAGTSFTVNIAATGYLTQSKLVTLAQVGAAVVDVALVQNTSSPMAPASLSGVVKNQNDVPLPNVTITVGTASALTDVNGAYQILGLSPGAATINATAANYQTVSATVTFAAGTRYTFSPKLSANGSTLPTVTSLTGVVVDAATNQPMTGVTVQLGAASQTTDASGTFTFSSISSGSFALTISAPGYQTVSASGIAALGGNNVGNIPLALAPTSSTLSGTVVDGATHLPVSGATVGVQGQGTPALTGADGKYSIGGLSGSVFTLNVTAAGYLSQSRSITLTQVGAIVVDVALQAQTTSDISFIKVATASPSYPASGLVPLELLIANSAAASTSLQVSAQVFNAQNSIVYEYLASPVIGWQGKTYGNNPVTIGANSTLELHLDWNTLRLPAGEYSIHANAVDGSGRVVAQGDTSFTVIEAASLAGGVTADPPLAQAGANTPISLTGDLTNNGNSTLPPGDLQLRIILDTPDTTENTQPQVTVRTVGTGAPMLIATKLVADAQGNLYTANWSDGKVIKIDSTGVQSILATVPGGTSAFDLALDGFGNLWVAGAKLIKIAPTGTMTAVPVSSLSVIYGIDFSASGVMFLSGIFNTNGEHRLVQRDSSGTETILWRNGLVNPTAMVKDDAGNYVVTNSGDGTLVKVSSVDGLISPFVAGLAQPKGITRDAAGNFYVANAGNNTIVKVSATGQTSTYATGFNQPYDLTFDGFGNLFVSNAGDDSILKVLPNGTVQVFAKGIANGPQGMKYDASGNLWIANDDGSVRKKDPQDNVTIIATGLTTLRGMAITGNGDVLVAETVAGRVSRISNGVKSIFASGLGNPFGVAIDPIGNVYITEQNAKRIARFDAAGNKLGVTESVLASPSVLREAFNGDVYIQNAGFLSVRTGGVVQIARRNFTYSYWVPDSVNGSVIALNGTSVLRVSAAGVVTTVKSVLPFTPQGLALDAAGNIILLDSLNKKLQKLDSSGNLTELVTLPATSAPGDLQNDAVGSLIVRLNTGAFYQVSSTGALSPITHSLSDYIYGWSASGNGQLIVWTYGKTYRIDARTGATTLWLANRGYYNNGLYISGAAMDGAGNLLLSDNTAHNLSAYSDSGAVLSQLDGFVGPLDIVWAGDELRFVDNGGRFYGFTDNAYPVKKAGSLPVNYLAQNGSDTLGIGAGTKVARWTGIGAGYDTYASLPIGGLTGIASKGDGNVAIAVNTTSRVIVLGAAKTIVKDYAGLLSPQGLAFDSAGRLYVANYGAGTVARFDSLASSSASTFSKISSPQNLVFDATGQLIVTKGAGVDRLAPDGTATVVTSSGAFKGAMVDGASLVVVDQRSSYLRKLNVGANNTWDIFAAGLAKPVAVRAADSGDVFVLNQSNNTVVKFKAGQIDLVAAVPAGMNALDIAADGSLTVVGNYGIAKRVALDGSVNDLNISGQVNQWTLTGAVESSNGKLYLVGNNPANSVGTVFELTVTQPVVPPAAGTVVYQTARSMAAMLADGSYGHFDFGTWVPPYGGDFKVELWRDGVNGKTSNFIHVGPNAQSLLSAAKAEVPPGDSSLSMCLDVKGADFTSISRVEISQVRPISKSGRPNGMAGDRAGNLYVTDSNSLYRTNAAGQSTLIAGGMALSFGLATDSQQNFYVASKNASSGRYELIRIDLQGNKTVVADLGVTTANGVQVNSQDEVLVGSLGKLLKVDKQGVVKLVTSAGFPSPRGIAVDGRDNTYVQNENDFVSMIKPDGTSLSIFSKGDGTIDPIFEGDNYPNIAADCADNFYIAPYQWFKINQNSEEHSIAQVVPRTGRTALLFDTLKVDPSLSDIDYLAFDRFSNRILMWNDGSGSIWQVPVTCGAIGVQAHLLAKPGQALTGSTKPPSATIPLADGRIEYVWNLRDVTAQGTQVCFDAAQLGVKLGEERKAIDSGFISFQNSFTSGEVTVPLTIPLVRAANLVSLNVATDLADYPANAIAQVSTTLDNANNRTISGTLNVQVFDSHDVLVGNVTQQAVTLPANGALPVSAPFAINTIVPAQYTVKAVLSDAGADLARAQTTFNVLPDNGSATAKSTVVTDKRQYNGSDRVVITSRVTNQSANIILENLTVMVQVYDAAGALQFSYGHSVPQLLPGTLRDYTATQTLRNAPEGIYTVKQTLSDSQGRVYDQPSTTYAVGSGASTGFGLTGSVSAAPKPVRIGETLTLNASATNSGNSALTNLPLKLSIIDPAAQQVVVEYPYTATINTGASYQASNTWQASGMVGASYVAVLTATVGSNTLTLAQDSFQLAAPIPADIGITVNASNVTPKYGETVVLSIALNNAGPGTARSIVVTNTLPGGLALLSATSDNGSVNSSIGVWTIASLASGTGATLSISAKVVGTSAMSDSASVSTAGTDPNNANNNASVTITPIKPLTGSIAAAPKPGSVDASMLFTGTVGNAGMADLTGVPLTLTVKNANTQAVLQQWTISANIAHDKSFSLAQNWSTTDVNPGDYLVQLAANFAGETQTLAQDSFTLIQAVKLDVQQTLANGSRVLVLVSCKDGESEVVASDGKPPVCLTTRTQIIDRALTELGVIHTIVTNEVAFKLAFRGGLYNTYWISGKEDKLHDELAGEIREAVFAGDGMILDGEHDQRNKTLDSVAGITWKGKLGETDLPVDIGGPLFSVETLNTVGRALKLDLNGSVQQAAFHGSKPNSTGPAILSNTYGSGHAMTFGFDLPFSLQAQGQWQAILGTSLQAVMPVQSATATPDALLSVKTSIANLAKAVDLEVKSILPAGAAYLAGNPAGGYTDATRTIAWAFNLAEAQTRDVFLLLQAPAMAGDSMLQTTVSSVRNGTVTPYGSTLTLPIKVISAAQSSADALKGLQALPLTQNKDQKLRDALVAELQNAMAAFNRNTVVDAQTAIDQLLDIAERMSGLPGDTTAVRLGIDRILKEAQWRWVLMQPPGSP